MKTIEDLLNYSNLINKLNLESKSIHYIIWFEEEYIDDDFLDINCPQFQSILINAEEKKVKLIIKNFDKAIKSQCGNNNLDLDKNNKDSYWDYSFVRKSNEGSLRKRFVLNKLIPNDEKVFKELWLRDFIKTITRISKNIKFITDIKSEEPEKLLKNNHTKIFKNDLGFNIFLEMFNMYKSQKNLLAYFSFLFYAMKKDFLVCSQIEFVRFLSSEKYDIHISKIDNRQLEYDMNNNKKSKLYNSIKYQITQKHKKSTIYEQ